MPDSVAYERTVKRLESRAKNMSIEEIRAQVDESFGAALRGLPHALVDDLKAHYLDAGSPEDKPGVFALAYHLADVVDLFGLSLPEHEDPFADEELAYLGELVSDFALDLDMDLVAYVMRRVVARGLL